jgi:hypothetical protein
MAPGSGRGYDADMSGTPSEIIFSVEDAPEGGFVARALGHSIFTEADNLDALRAAVRDAIRCHFDDAERPKVIRLDLVRYIARGVAASARGDSPAGSARSTSQRGAYVAEGTD